MSEYYKPGETVPPLVGEEKRVNGYDFNDQNKYKEPYRYDQKADFYQQAVKDGKTSMILGIIACCCTILNVFGLVFSVVTGVIGLIKAVGARRILKAEDKGKANAGFVCSIVALSVSAFILFILLVVVFISGRIFLHNGINEFGGGFYF